MAKKPTTTKKTGTSSSRKAESPVEPKPNAKGSTTKPKDEAQAKAPAATSAKPSAAAPKTPMKPSGAKATKPTKGPKPSANAIAAASSDSASSATASDTKADPATKAAADAAAPANKLNPASPAGSGQTSGTTTASKKPDTPSPKAAVPEKTTKAPPASAPEPEPVPKPEPKPEPKPVPKPIAEPQQQATAETPSEPAVYHAPRPSLFIVHITPEMAPVAKIGGLADVVFGLSRELAIRGNHVEIILPKYDNLRYDQIFELQPVYNDLWVPWYDGAIHCTVYFGFVHDRKCFFIEPHSHDNFFNRGSVYGFPDDVLRYAFFSRAAIEFLWQSGKHPDIIHCHDWQTALIPVFLYEFYQRLGMTHPRVCLTIHNFKHQGVTGAELLHATGLHQPDHFFDWQRMGDNHHKNALNLLKGGVVYSNFVTTVSPRYSFETKDQGQGFGLEPTLHTHHMKYGGVVNGIDYDVWNPEIDRYIPVRYGLGNLDDKYENKRALRHRLMLADNEKPIVAFIGRLDPQKGLELVRHAIFSTLEHGAQFVLLGSSPDQGINNDFWGLKQMLNDSPDCHLEIGFDEDLSHLIYAGADIMLVPSQFEPCGLTQLIALRYGTVPVVRTVGGLADTVFDKDHSDRPLHQRNGYRFDNYDVPGLESALIRALDCYYQYPEHFRELMKNAMRADYSWNHPGQDYLNIYDFIRDR